MKASLLALLTFLNLTALAAEASAKHGDDQTTSTGVYWVPVDERELTEFSVFPVKDIEVSRDKGVLKLEYTLPLELTGVPNHIEIKGTIVDESSPVQLTGGYGHATCPSASDLSHCAITYRNLNIDAAARTDLFKQIVKSPTELELRERIAARFCVASTGGEPCGFLRVNENAVRPAKRASNY